MISNLEIQTSKGRFRADLEAGSDISIPLNEGTNNPNCYFADHVEFETIRSGDFIGSVKEGGSVNYQKLIMTPHGNGTHTECYGHISDDPNVTLNRSLTRFHFIASLITVSPESKDDDLVITNDCIDTGSIHPAADSVVIRTLPNDSSKTARNYSGQNPPYFDPAAIGTFVDLGIIHLLIDLPSIDREDDGGKLLSHKTFWQYPGAIRHEATITELIFVPGSVPDGLYLLNLQITSLEMDASPSKPVLYPLIEL